MKVFMSSHRGPIDLGPGEFLAKGGQGAVYVRDKLAFKIYHDPQLAMPAGKLAELSALSAPWFVRPSEMLRDKHGQIVGYAMPRLSRRHVLCRLFTRAFRKRHGLTPEMAVQIAEQMRDRLSQVHRAGLVVVDFNEMNFLVSELLDDVAFIDADSYQTPSYPALAVMDSVRDRHASHFSAATDWFSFAVVAFQLLIGIHPFKGKHPNHALASMDARMKANVSVLHPDVSMPPVCRPLTVIPRPWRAWFEAVFERGERSSPPSQAGITAGTLVVAPTVSPTNRRLTVTPLLDAGELGEIRRLAFFGGVRVVVCDGGVIVDGKPIATDVGRDPRLGLTPSGRPYLGSLAQGRLVLSGLSSVATDIELDLRADALSSAAGGIVVRVGRQLRRVRCFDNGAHFTAATLPLGQVHPAATQCFDGVVVQCLLGRHHLGLVGRDGCEHLPMPELDDWRVVFATRRDGVTVLVVEQQGRFERWVYRRDAGGSDLRRVPDVGPSEPELAVLDTGVAVVTAEDGSWEIFAAAPGNSDVRILDAADVADLRSPTADGGALLAVRGTEVVRVTMNR